MKNVIKVKDLQVSFKKEDVLKDVSFTLESGKIYGFLGNNGAGKTTTLKAIFNEVIFQKGVITFNSIPQKQIDYSKWFFFSENNELPLNLKIKEYLQIMTTLANHDYKKAKMEFVDFTKKFNVNFKQSKKIKDLSAGERKILSSLLAIILNPEVIFFDEPTANLDIKNKEIIINMIKLMKSQNRIIVITTHLIDEVKDLLTDLIILDQGKITYKKEFDNNQENLKVIFTNNTFTNTIDFNSFKENFN